MIKSHFGLRWPNTGQIYRKVESADRGNQFLNMLQIKSNYSICIPFRIYDKIESRISDESLPDTQCPVENRIIPGLCRGFF